MNVYYRDPIVYRRRQKRPKNKYKKRAKRIVLFLVLLLIGAIYLGFKSEVPDGEAKINPKLIDQSSGINVEWPSKGQAAIGTVEGGLLASSDADEQPRPIASLAKVITALAVLEKAPLEPGQPGISIIFDDQDEANYHEYLSKLGTVTAVTAGHTMSQYQALQAMLLPSSNNMSDSLVRRIFGSVEEYAKYANDMLDRYGLYKTWVDDASGFSPKTVSTPSEMIIIGQKALENPVIAEIVAQKEAEIPLAGVVPNYNRLIRVENVTGIKPGNTDEAGWCLLFSAKYQIEDNQEVTVLGVVLGQDNPDELFVASQNLLNSARLDLKQVEVVRGGEVVGTFVTPWGDESALIAQESLWTYSWRGNVPAPEVLFSDQNAPLAANQTIGTMHLGRDSNKGVPVVLGKDIKRPSLLWRLKNSLALSSIF